MVAADDFKPPPPKKLSPTKLNTESIFLLGDMAASTFFTTWLVRSSEEPSGKITAPMK